MLSTGTELSSSQTQSSVIAVEEGPKSEQEVWSTSLGLIRTKKEGM